MCFICLQNWNRQVGKFYSVRWFLKGTSTNWLSSIRKLNQSNSFFRFAWLIWTNFFVVVQPRKTFITPAALFIENLENNHLNHKLRIKRFTTNWWVSNLSTTITENHNFEYHINWEPQFRIWDNLGYNSVPSRHLL